MAQSNHHRPDDPAGDEKRAGHRGCGGARSFRLDASASARHNLVPNRPVSAADKACAVGFRSRVGQARP